MVRDSEFQNPQILYQLLADFLAGSISVSLFCANFETAFNFDVDRKALSASEHEVFDKLFSEVVHFSEFPEDHAIYSGYRNEAQIEQAALQAKTALQSGQL